MTRQLLESLDSVEWLSGLRAVPAALDFELMLRADSEDGGWTRHSVSVATAGT